MRSVGTSRSEIEEVPHSFFGHPRRVPANPAACSNISPCHMCPFGRPATLLPSPRLSSARSPPRCKMLAPRPSWPCAPGQRLPTHPRCVGGFARPATRAHPLNRHPRCRRCALLSPDERSTCSLIHRRIIKAAALGHGPAPRRPLPSLSALLTEGAVLDHARPVDTPLGQQLAQQLAEALPTAEPRPAPVAAPVPVQGGVDGIYSGAYRCYMEVRRGTLLGAAAWPPWALGRPGSSAQAPQGRSVGPHPISACRRLFCTRGCSPHRRTAVASVLPTQSCAGPPASGWVPGLPSAPTCAPNTTYNPRPCPRPACRRCDQQRWTSSA